LETSVQKMEAQLKLWRSKIDGLAAETHMAGARSGFDALMYVDELKALHAIAQERFDEYKSAGEAERAHLQGTLKSAWGELDAALATPNPSYRAKERLPQPISGREGTLATKGAALTRPTAPGNGRKTG
jgi:hypothetical protein